MRVFWLKGKAGLGNRLKALVAATAYCGKTGRVLVVDWRDQSYSSDGSNSFGYFFSLNGVETIGIDEVGKPKSVWPPVWRTNLGKECNFVVKKHCSEQSSVWFGDFGRKEEVVVGWSYNAEYELLAKAYGCSEFDALRRFMQKNLVIDAALVRECEDFIAANGLLDATAVHVRLSDNLRLKQRHKTNVVNFMVAAKAFGGKLFLCTDNSDVLAQFTAKFGNDVVSWPKWYPTPGKKMHQSKDCKNKKTNMRDVIADMYIMSRCRRMLRETRNFR